MCDFSDASLVPSAFLSSGFFVSLFAYATAFLLFLSLARSLPVLENRHDDCDRRREIDKDEDVLVCVCVFFNALLAVCLSLSPPLILFLLLSFWRSSSARQVIITSRSFCRCRVELSVASNERCSCFFLFPSSFEKNRLVRITRIMIREQHKQWRRSRSSSSSSSIVGERKKGMQRKLSSTIELFISIAASLLVN